MIISWREKYFWRTDVRKLGMSDCKFTRRIFLLLSFNIAHALLNLSCRVITTLQVRVLLMPQKMIPKMGARSHKQRRQHLQPKQKARPRRNPKLSWTLVSKLATIAGKWNQLVTFNQHRGYVRSHVSTHWETLGTHAKLKIAWIFLKTLARALKNGKKFEVTIHVWQASYFFSHGILTLEILSCVVTGCSSSGRAP